MSRHFARHLVATLALMSGITQAQTGPATPYAGQQLRAIKALSDSDISGLLSGQGAGLAKSAELNGYPGPAHVLELSTDLHLNEAQAAATRQLMAQHRLEASRLGAALVDAERQLDSLFAQRHATPAEVDRSTARIGQLQAQLRAEHLKTHLAQTALLSAHQVQRYTSLRGYESASPAAHGAPAKHGHSSNTTH